MLAELAFQTIRRLPSLALVALALLTVRAAQGGEQPSAPPVLRLESGMRTAPIRAATLDAGGRLLATGRGLRPELCEVRPAGGSGIRRLNSLVARDKAPGGGHPYSVAFSPAASVVAVGYGDTLNVDILSVSELRRLAAPDVSDLATDWPTISWPRTSAAASCQSRRQRNAFAEIDQGEHEVAAIQKPMASVQQYQAAFDQETQQMKIPPNELLADAGPPQPSGGRAPAPRPTRAVSQNARQMAQG